MKSQREGSLTVEAAFIMPMILLSVFALIYLTFYLHDKCRIYGVTDKVLHKSILAIKHDADVETGEISFNKINERGVFYLPLGSTDIEKEKISNYLQRELSKGLFLCQITVIEVKVDKFKVSITVKAKPKITMPGLSNIAEPFSTISVTAQAQIHNPAEQIRLSEVVLETGEKIKGVKSLKEKLLRYLK